MSYPINTQTQVIRYNDYDGERSTVKMTGTLLTAANFDAQIAAALALRDAIADLTKGLRVSFDIGNRYETVSPKTKSTDVEAQRETKWLVRYFGADASGPYRMEIPCPDRAFLDPNNRGFMLLTGTEGLAFVAAFEAYVKLPGDVAVVVDSVEHVGRNI